MRHRMVLCLGLLACHSNLTRAMHRTQSRSGTGSRLRLYYYLQSTSHIMKWPLFWNHFSKIKDLTQPDGKEQAYQVISLKLFCHKSRQKQSSGITGSEGATLEAPFRPSCAFPLTLVQTRGGSSDQCADSFQTEEGFWRHFFCHQLEKWVVSLFSCFFLFTSPRPLSYGQDDVQSTSWVCGGCVKSAGGLHKKFDMFWQIMMVNVNNQTKSRNWSKFPGMTNFNKAAYLGQWYEYSNVFEFYEDLPCKDNVYIAFNHTSSIIWHHSLQQSFFANCQTCSQSIKMD